jgi:hypothetical protein
MIARNHLQFYQTKLKNRKHVAQILKQNMMHIACFLYSCSFQLQISHIVACLEIEIISIIENSHCNTSTWTFCPQIIQKINKPHIEYCKAK